MAIDKVKKLSKTIEVLEAKRAIALEKSLQSNDPETLYKANLELNELVNKKNPKDPRKSFFIDPFEFQSSFGYKDRKTSISYAMLRSMAKTPVINAILRTRINQIASFAEPQKDEFSIGYKIRKKGSNVPGNKSTPDKSEQKKIEELTMFIEECGMVNTWGNDDFDTFVRKYVRDSLSYDQAVFEVESDKKGIPVAFYPVDGATCRIADDYNSEKYREFHRDRMPEKIDGYYPSHVQIFNDKVVAQFYPWELCFGIRNPSNNFYNYGYGVSELEELISVITALLWGEEYNRNFFKQGSAPKGILKVNGNFGDSRLAEFRQQWNATIRGVSNSWKTPVLEADKVDWIDLQRTNRDMEFTNWIEFLIKVSCAVFTIDPSEVNFPLNGAANSQPLFEGNADTRIKHSKDKGLYPILKFLQKRINKWIINRIDPEYEFVFVGLDSMTPKEQAEYDKTLLQTRKTFNELRQKYGDEPVEGGDIIGDSTFMQNKQMDAQNAMMAEGGGGEMMGEEGGEEQMSEEDQQLEQLLGEETQKAKESNPFVNSLNNYLKTLR